MEQLAQHLEPKTWKDLPKMTDWGNWYSDMDIDYFINHWLPGEIAEGLVLEPDFQRGHVWTIEQRIAFMEFIIKGGKCPDILFNAPNWTSVSADGTYVLVDGLQRITTLQMFLNNEFPVFGGYYKKDIQGKMPRFEIRVRVNTLKTRKEVLQWYLELNTGGTPHSKEEITRVQSLLTTTSN